MTEHLTFSGLVEEMEGKDTLKGWDVLVSYDEDQINQLLASRAGSLAGLCQLDDIETTYTDLLRKKTYPAKLSLKLKAPTLKFVSTESVTLSFPMSGTYQIGKEDPDELPDDLVMTITTQLVNVHGTLADGDVSTAEFVPAKETGKKKSGEIIIFEPGVSKAHGVCIDFPSATYLKLSGGESAQDLVKNAETKLLDHFSKSGLKYYIAGLSNTYGTFGSSQLLRPKSFCFSVIPEKAGENIKGSLCMWIAVEGGNGNKQEQASGSGLVFHPKDKPVHPIPKGRSASIIFSHEVMINYIKKQFENKKFTNVNSSNSTKDKVGMELTAKYDQQISVPAVKTAPSSITGGLHESVEALEFNVKDSDINLKFNSLSDPSPSDPKKKKEPFEISFSIKKSVKWKTYNDSIFIEGTSTVTGEVEVTCSFSGKGNWEGPEASQAAKTPNLLKLVCSADSLFKVDPVSTVKDNWFFHRSSDVPKQLKTLKVEVPKIDFQLDSLDYFLTTNLILPGAHVFKADTPISVVGVEYGLAVPRDTILTGTIAASLE